MCVTGVITPPPLGMWMTSHGQCPRGVCACECPRVGVFFKFSEGRMTSRGQCPRGGACEKSCIRAWTPPPPPFQKSWIRAWCVCVCVWGGGNLQTFVVSNCQAKKTKHAAKTFGSNIPAYVYPCIGLRQEDLDFITS